MPSIEVLNREHPADFVLGTLCDAWLGFDVMRFHAREAINSLYEFDITLSRPAKSGPADLDALLNRGASFRVRTETRWRVVHGVVVEAEELDRTRKSYFYRFKLAPPIWRSKHRVRCRTFVDNTLEEILVTVLENRATFRGAGSGGLKRQSGEAAPPPVDPEFGIFLEPTGAYRFAVSDMSRLCDVELRRYVVQYNETDFDFLSRLLEEEGLAYYFEHEDSRVVMTITDRPGFVPLFTGEITHRLCSSQSGLTTYQEVVHQLRKVRRLRAQAVTLRDWDEIRAHRVLEASAMEDGADPEIFGRCEFPGRDEGNVDTPDQQPAIIRLERSSMEREVAEGRGNVRTLEPGLRFTLHDESALREDDDLVVTAVETYATQYTPEGGLPEWESFGLSGRGQPIGDYDCRFEVVPAGIAYRPALITPRPRVDGVHSAVVTADEFRESDRPEIHCNEDGWVRVRFPWDQRKEEAMPSSCYVRASQGWAGAGFGAMYIPRVGQEVLVAYYQGDVERPVIVGRVYNTIQPVPYALPQKKTVSTLKSQSSPGGEGFNELRFEDMKGEEEVFLHAEKNLNEVVKASHSASVGGDQSYGVGGNQNFSVKGNQTNSVTGVRSVHVGGMQHVTQKGFTSDAENDHAFTSINASFALGEMLEVIAQDARFQLGNSFKILAPKMSCQGTSAYFNEGAVFTALGNSAMLTLSRGIAKLSNGAGASIELVGGRVTVRAPGGFEVINCPIAKVHAGEILLHSDANLDMSAATINGRAGSIKLNG